MRGVIRYLFASLLAAIVAPTLAATPAELQEQVRRAETAFAASMASRDFNAFSEWLSEEAVFFGDKDVAHGKPAVQSAWKPFFDGEVAPFSWRSESVEVLPSGTLAHSSGPVFDSSGRQVGAFNSIWRLENGRWRVIFDKGCSVCNCK
jgi:ketosteroid isomerase-like protein